MKSRQRDVVFPCGDINLEGVYYFSDGNAASPAVIVCHPHPLYGGSMYNNVTLAISSALVAQSIVALIFNFRGVGRSQGSFGEGISEQDDATAALDWLASQPEVNPDKLGIAGYSFGATVALPVGCRDMRVKAIALISPPIDASQMTSLKGCSKPKLVVHGGRDSLIPSVSMEPVLQEVAEPKRFEFIGAADHFWVGFETQLSEKVAIFFYSLFAKN